MKLAAPQAARSRFARLARHPVARNAAALYAVLAARYLVPLALVPFLARVLRPEAFGRLAVAQSLAATLGIIVEFGFLLSATREVARERDSPTKLREIAAGVLGAKVLLAATTALVGLILVAVVPDFRSHPAFLWGACAVAVARGASPAWFFQGVERMPLQTAIEGGAMAAAAAAVFVFIRVPGQATWVLYFSAAGVLAAALVNHLRMYRWVPFARPRVRPVVHMLRSSFAMFCSRCTFALYGSANVFLLGLFVPAAQTADFAGPEKIVQALLALYYTANQAVFPRFSNLMKHNRSRAIRLAWLIALVGFALGALAATVLIIAAPWIVRVALGPGYAAAVPVLRWLALLVIILAVPNVLGSAILLPLGMDWAVTAVAVVTAAVNTVALLLLVPRFADLGMAWSQIVSATAALGCMLYFVRRAVRRSAAEAACPASS